MSISGFTSPWWLALIVVVAALAVGYVIVQRLRHRHVLRFANLELLDTVAPTRRRWTRHIPTVLVLCGVLMLTVALAGPTAATRIPRNRATVMLVIDVSLSMQSTDVAPTRIAAAQQAAKTFTDRLPPGINLGLVSFAGTASVLVSPTTNRDETKNAIDHLQLSERTATGEGIFAALQATDTLAGVIGGAEEPPPARIVLESDGKQTVPESLDDPRGGYTAARAAKAKNVAISTISFGTSWGTVDIPDASGGSQRVPVPVDDASLQQIAQLSGGSFFTAASLDDLNRAYDSLQQQIGFETIRGDASRPWVMLAALVIVTGFATALILRQRIP